MKKMPLLFLIPMIAILVAVGIASAIKLMSTTPPSTTDTAREFPNPYANETTSTSSFLSKLLGYGNSPTPTPDTAIDLTQELKSTFDDGGTTELDALEEEIAGL